MSSSSSSRSLYDISPDPPSYSEILESEKKETIQPKSKLRIIILLDASGSMCSMKTEAIQAVNLFIKKQQEFKANDEVVFDLFTFNSESMHLINSQPIAGINPVPEEKYITEGSTSLYDTIGHVMELYRTEHDVLLVVMTDGNDTSSKKYTAKSIKSLLSKRKIPPFDWETVWLGADPTVTQIGTDLGVSASSSVNFGMLREYSDQVFSSAVSEYRHGKASGKKKALELKAYSEL